MIRPEIVTYVREQLEQRVPPDGVRQALLTAGWAPEDVADSFAEITAAAPALVETASYGANQPSPVAVWTSHRLPGLFKSERQASFAIIGVGVVVSVACVGLAFSLLNPSASQGPAPYSMTPPPVLTSATTQP